MRQLYCFFICWLLLPLHSWAQADQTVGGAVGTEAGMPLPGATVFIKGTYLGSSTNEEGQFQLKADFSGAPVVLSVSFVGYETQDVPLNGPDQALQITLRPSAVLDQVVVAASRVEESIGQVPVTVEKLTQRQVEQLTTPDLVAGLGRFRGIDISSSSMFTTSFSTRGFNSSRSERTIQLDDYVDTQLPSLSSNFGNMLGAPILDIASVELVHGPNSALYGANAFNGVLLTNSRDPFKDPGLTVRLRGGNRDLLDGQLRYAVKIGSRVAFKISGGVLRATDFAADDQRATSTLIEPANNPAGSSLGYDAVNRYGDVGAYTFGATFFDPQAKQSVATPAELRGKTLFLPGYSEAQLLAGDNKTHLYKIAPSLSVLLTKRVKATIAYKYGESNTTYQSASRYRFVNSGVHQGRAQVEGSNWFVRAFTTHDFSGARDPKTDGSYNLGFLGGFLQTQDAPGPAASYAEGYVGAYLATLAGNLNAGQSVDASTRAAASAAAPTQLQPGTAEFEAARNRLIHDPTPGQGARLIIRSILNEGSGQYTHHNAVADLTVGGAYRQFLLGSDGSLFEDTKDGSRLKNYEYGGYAQVSKVLFDDHLKLAATGRVDRFQNFGTAFSPRASVVYSLGADKLQNFRASFSRAFRAPTQNDQYIKLDVSRAILLGNVRQGYDGYSLGVLRGGSFADAANLYHADKLRLEEVNTAEVGYRAQFGKQLYVDVDYFYNRYNNFIATQNFLGNTDGSRPTAAQIGAAAPGRFQTSAFPTRIIQIAANVDQRVQSHGAGITLSYAFAPALTLSGNYSFNKLITEDFKTGTQSFYNTPNHKFNVGLDGQALKQRLSYNLNYRWVEAFRYESTFATGTVPEAQTVDAQVGFTIRALRTTLQAGGTNLLDARNYQVYGAPNFGRIAYVGLLVDIK